MVSIIRKTDEMFTFTAKYRSQDKTIGLVPTMGYLHDGHMSLVNASIKENDFTVVSLFVNPTQFGPGEDLDKYPRDEEQDLKLLEEAGVDILFAPSPEEMYFPDHSTYVNESTLSLPLCGESRPGHFRGVCTVVLKLFNIITPDRAYFGMKDYQQLQVLKRMVRDLNVPVQIRPCPLIREKDGLALSSRNAYLSPDDRTSALKLSESLKAAKTAFTEGERNASVILDLIHSILNREERLKPEYVEIRDAENLSIVDEISSPIVIAMAIRAGKTRLIDNIILGESL